MSVRRVSIRAVWRTVGLVACVFMAAACNNVASITDVGSPLRDEAKVKAAASAKATSDAIDYLAPIKEERSNQAKLLGFELTAVRSFALARRNSELMELLTDDRTPFLTGRLKGKIEARLAALAGTHEPHLDRITVDDLRALSDGDTIEDRCGGTFEPPSEGVDVSARIAERVSILAIKINECEDWIARAQQGFALAAGFAAAGCPISGEIAAPDEKALKAQVAKFRKAFPGRSDTDADVIDFLNGEDGLNKEYASACRQGRADQAAFRALLLGCGPGQCPGANKTGSVTGLSAASLIVKTFVRLAEAQQDLATAKAEARNAQNALAEATDQYEKAAKANLDAPGTETQAEVDEAVKAIKSALEALQAAGGALGVDIAAAEQIKQIDLVLEAAGSGTFDESAVTDPELAGALGVVNTLPSFIDQIKFIEGQAKAPPLSSLILEKARLQALSAEAKRAVRRTEREIALLNETLSELTREVSLQGQALRSVRDAGDMSTQELVERTAPQAQRLALVVGLERYLSSFTVMRQRMHEIGYEEIALIREASIDKSETSLLVWKSTIQVPVDALLAYHESGLKQEDIIELLKALGIGAIAAGVM